MKKLFAFLAGLGWLCTICFAQQEIPSSVNDSPGTEIKAGPRILPDGSYRVGGEVLPAKLLSAGEGHYTQEALDAGFQTKGLVFCVVGADGTASRVVAGPEFSRGLRDEAANAVRDSRFQPGSYQGKAVPVRLRLAVSFRLNAGKPEVRVYEPGDDELAELIRAHSDARRQEIFESRGVQSNVDGHEKVMPRAVHVSIPEFTEAARRAKYQGIAIVSLLVDEQGRPTDIKVVKGLDYGLTEQAIRCAERYQFSPGTVDGVPTPMRISIEMNFRLY